MPIDKTVTITLNLSAAYAQALTNGASQNFYNEQPDRFEKTGGREALDPDAAVFDGGTIHWVDGIAEAILYQAWEQAQGHSVTLIWDTSQTQHGVLSSRSWAKESALPADVRRRD